MRYILQLSTKESFPISEEELEKFENNIGANFIRFDYGVINPSFVVSILVDEEASENENRKKLNTLNGNDVSDEDKEIIRSCHSQSDIKQIKNIDSLLKKYTKNLIVK